MLGARSFGEPVLNMPMKGIAFCANALPGHARSALVAARNRLRRTWPIFPPREVYFFALSAASSPRSCGRANNYGRCPELLFEVDVGGLDDLGVAVLLAAQEARHFVGRARRGIEPELRQLVLHAGVLQDLVHLDRQ